MINALSAAAADTMDGSLILSMISLSMWADLSLDDLSFLVPDMAVDGYLVFSLISMTMLGEVRSTETVQIRIRGEVSVKIAHALHQEKLIKGKSKQDVIAEALELYFHREERLEK